MPESSSDPNRPKRNLPSWMSSKEPEGNSGKKKKSDEDAHKVKETSNQAKQTGASSSHDTDFSKLLNGVVFAISGFVNPERGNLRTQAMDMGAEYRPDWNPNCTLLVCAFANTPKFKQVESDNGTIVSKEWIYECYDKRKLVPIEPYLMHVGKPWRKQSKDKSEITQDEKKSPKKEPQKPHREDEDTIESKFSPSRIKNWAKNDLTQTISWLQSQEEKPEKSKIKEIAAEGIITCMQDAIESLQQNNGINEVTEQWEIVPRAVKEIAELEKTKKESLSKDKILGLFMKCKKIYVGEFENSNFSTKKEKKIKDEEYDSDKTVEMTEEEIKLACGKFLENNE